MAKSNGNRYTDADFIELLNRVATGRTITSVCKDPDMPTRETFYQWISKATKEQSDLYARAKELHADAMADEILQISDDATADTYADDYGNPKQNHEWVNRSRLRVDSRKWLLSKLLPKKYGDSVQVDTTVATHNATEIQASNGIEAIKQILSE